MIGMEVESASYRHLQKTLSDLGNKFPKDVVDLLHKEGLIIESDAKRNLANELPNSPVKANGKHWYTGRTGASIHNRPFQNGVSVSTNVKYAPYVEFGTGDMVVIPPGWEAFASKYKGRGIRKINNRARPFLVKAFIEETHKIMSKLLAIYRKIVK